MTTEDGTKAPTYVENKAGQPEPLCHLAEAGRGWRPRLEAALRCEKKPESQLAKG